MKYYKRKHIVPMCYLIYSIIRYNILYIYTYIEYITYYRMERKWSMIYIIKRKNFNQFMCFMLVISMLAILTPTKQIIAAVVQDADLIKEVSNPANKVIRFKITVPSKTKVEYTVSLKPFEKGPYQEKIVNTYNNTTNEKISRYINVPVSYYSNSYEIVATYTRGRTFKDSSSANSNYQSSQTSNMFVWDSKAIKDYNTVKGYTAVYSFACSLLLDVVVTKGSASLGTMVEIVGYGSDGAGIVQTFTGSAVSTKGIENTPIKGWGYKIKLVPTTDGYTKYLLVYDEYGRFYKEFNMGKMTINYGIK